jgi:hypothetical protein
VRRTELVTATALTVAGLGVIGVIIPRYVADIGVSSALSPAFMPYVAAVLTTVGAASLLVAELRGHGGDAVPFTKSNWRFLGASVAVLIGSCLLMSILGYLVGGVAVVAGMLLLARVRPSIVIAAAVLAPIAVWLLFTKLLATPLP